MQSEGFFEWGFHLRTRLFTDHETLSTCRLLRKSGRLLARCSSDGQYDVVLVQFLNPPVLIESKRICRFLIGSLLLKTLRLWAASKTRYNYYYYYYSSESFRPFARISFFLPSFFVYNLLSQWPFVPNLPKFIQMLKCINFYQIDIFLLWGELEDLGPLEKLPSSFFTDEILYKLCTLF